MSGLVLKTAPVDEPVSRTDALLYLRQVSGTPDDALVDDLIAMATDQIENITEYQFQDATYIQYFDGWPKYQLINSNTTDRIICLDKPPLQSVTSIKYIDADGNEQTVASSNYNVRNNKSTESIIEWDSDYTLPTLTDNRIDSVYVEYVCGWESWQSGVPGVPTWATQAIKLLVNEIYEHRLFQQEGNITGSLQQNSWAMQLMRGHSINTPTAIGAGGSIPSPVIV